MGKRVLGVSAFVAQPMTAQMASSVRVRLKASGRRAEFISQKRPPKGRAIENSEPCWPTNASAE